MALITIRGDDGQSHLIHTSQLGGFVSRIMRPSQWAGVWERFDAALSRTPQTEGEGSREVKKPEILKPEGGET